MVLMIIGVYDSCPHGTAAPWFTLPEAQWNMDELCTPLFIGNIMHFEYAPRSSQVLASEKMQPVKKRRASYTSNSTRIR